MLTLINQAKETPKLGVFILQCVQTGLITKEEARAMLFVNSIGARK